MTAWTQDEAEEAVAKLGPDDVAVALHHAAKHGSDPIYVAALQARPAAAGEAGRRSHRRGRRG